MTAALQAVSWSTVAATRPCTSGTHRWHEVACLLRSQVDRRHSHLARQRVDIDRGGLVGDAEQAESLRVGTGADVRGAEIAVDATRTSDRPVAGSERATSTAA